MKWKKKLLGFSYSKNMENFAEFCWNISSSINFLFLKSAPRANSCHPQQTSSHVYISDMVKVEDLKSHTMDLSHHITNNSIKKILYYTSFIDHEDLLFGVGHNPFIEKGCPVTNCFVTNNRSLLSEYYIIKFWSHVDKFS